MPWKKYVTVVSGKASDKRAGLGPSSDTHDVSIWLTGLELVAILNVLPSGPHVE